jgi:hypothetical protein
MLRAQPHKGIFFVGGEDNAAWVAGAEATDDPMKAGHRSEKGSLDAISQTSGDAPPAHRW